jgi:hypothetical protein
MILSFSESFPAQRHRKILDERHGVDFEGEKLVFAQEFKMDQVLQMKNL